MISLLVAAAIGLSAQTAGSLDRGPVIYYRDSDTVAIAGHRTHGPAPFRHIDDLRSGDVIKLAARRFRVVRSAIVRPEETWVLNYSGLILSACSRSNRQPTSASYRLVVFAREEET